MVDRSDNRVIIDEIKRNLLRTGDKKRKTKTTIGKGTSETGVLPRENHTVNLSLSKEPSPKLVA